MTSSNSNHLLIVSGPSGVGKGTIISALLERNPTLSVAISATTRRPRTGETSGTHYYFMNHAEFRKLANNGEFLEWCEVHGNLYGTLKSEISRLNSIGKTVLLEIDTQGAMKVKESNPGCKLIFIEPPSMSELESRLRSRGTEKSDVVARRIEGAKVEMSAKGSYDIRVTNSTVAQSVNEIEKFILSLGDIK
ncbi:guanylate kinase [bacterium]|nr:guanylate kinase [bacterium]